VNVVSPGPVTNEVFTKTLGNVLNRPTFMSVPAPVAKLVFGEMAEEIFLTSIRAVPRNLLHAEYNFKYPELEGALRGLLNK
jgi:NAD dependent epimerase/dehydratase family enzyme